MRRSLPPRRITAACSVLLLLAGCGPKAPPAPPPPAVTVSVPLQLAITDWDEFTGRITAVDSVEVRARVDGYIESAGFSEGAMVKAGDVLFVIDQRPYVAELTRARAEAAARTTIDVRASAIRFKTNLQSRCRRELRRDRSSLAWA